MISIQFYNVVGQVGPPDQGTTSCDSLALMTCVNKAGADGLPTDFMVDMAALQMKDPDDAGFKEYSEALCKYER